MIRVFSLSIPMLALFTVLSLAPAAAAPPSADADASMTVGGPQGGAEMAPIDINSASLTELRSLPGIGRVYATKIVESRPYGTVEDLKNRKVLPEGTYARIHEKVVASPTNDPEETEPDTAPLQSGPPRH